MSELFNTEAMNKIIQGAVVSAMEESGPQLLKGLVDKMLTEKVDPSTGRNDGYSSNRIPLLEYFTQRHLHSAIERAIGTWFNQNAATIDAEIQAAISANGIADSLVSSVRKAIADGFVRVNVDLKAEPERSNRYD